MKCLKILLIGFLVAPLLVLSQETVQDTAPEIPALPAFHNPYIIENATNEILPKEGMEFQIKHRFGLISGGDDDWGGIFAPSNIHIGLAYGVHKNVTLGIGATKFDRLLDFNWKVALLRQTRSDKKPFSISYNGNMVINVEKDGDFEFAQDRFAYFHQLNLVRRFGPNLSLQLAPSISHYNFVEFGMKNILFSAGLGGRYKVTPKTSILLDYNQPFSSGTGIAKPKAGMAIGVEFATLGHAFQLFVTNYNGLIPQKNIMFNQNDFFDGDFMIGFNITRIYRFKPTSIQ